MKSLFFIVAILCYSVTWSQNHCQKGQENYEAKKYTEAIKALQVCLQDQPKNENAQYLLGRSHAELEQWKEAADVYEKLVEANPDHADYNFLYGGSLGLYAKSINPLKSMGYISDIKFYLKKAIQLDQKHIDARWALVQIYMELPFIVGGSKSTSEDYADELLDISPIDGHLAFGYIEAYEENWAKAEKHYKKAVEVGQSETAYQKLIDIQLQQDKIEEAKNTLKEAYRATRNKAFKEQLDAI